MTDTNQTPMQRMLGDFAPKLVDLTDTVLYGDVWARDALSPRDRAIVTVASFIGGGDADKVEPYLQAAKANGVTRDEIIEVITHLAFYSGWPKAVTAMNVAKRVFSD